MPIYDDAARAADDLIRRLSAGLARKNSRLLESSRQLAESAHPSWRLAEDLLRQPLAIGRAEEFIGDNGLELGRHIGGGAESLVWEVAPRTGGASHVLKVRPDGLASDFDLPAGVPGIVPYWATEQVSPGASAALQKKAFAYSPGSGMQMPFSQAAERVKESLLSRGWHWSDSHKQNLGLLPDGSWGVFDGWVDRAHPAWSLPQIPPEQAVRMLRSTPGERAAIYGSANLQGFAEP